MTRDAIETAVREGIPFTINMADGKSYEVREPWQIAVGTARIVVLDERSAPRPSHVDHDRHALSTERQWFCQNHSFCAPTSSVLPTIHPTHHSPFTPVPPFPSDDKPNRSHNRRSKAYDVPTDFCHAPLSPHRCTHLISVPLITRIEMKEPQSSTTCQPFNRGLRMARLKRFRAQDGRQQRNCPRCRIAITSCFLPGPPTSSSSTRRARTTASTSCRC